MSDSTTITERFRDALRSLEESSSTDDLVDLYASGCSVGNVVDGEAFSGHDGVREFWTIYREQFDEVSSEFAVIAGDDSGGVLEWTTTGTSNGHEVSYRGATVLEVADGEITRSMAYYDPADLGRQVVES
ncbi:nuclear transport factor 2 family protein [Ilumatobacter sp.]|uniref:nuclear transport factor 2 family protein n=1 Tax=Ilumatobacter sp. TaxID=1967498 RepID=UPI003B52A013